MSAIKMSEFDFGRQKQADANATVLILMSLKFNWDPRLTSLLNLLTVGFDLILASEVGESES